MLAWKSTRLSAVIVTFVVALAVFSKPATASPIIITAIPSGVLDDGLGNTATLLANPDPNTNGFLPNAIVADFHNSTGILLDFTIGAVGSLSGFNGYLENVLNDTSDFWSGFLLTTAGPNGGGAAFLASSLASSAPASIVFAPIDANGFTPAALLLFNTPIAPSTNFLFSFLVAYDVTGAADQGLGSPAYIVNETPIAAVPEPASLMLFGTGLGYLVRRRRNRKA